MVVKELGRKRSIIPAIMLEEEEDDDLVYCVSVGAKEIFSENYSNLLGRYSVILSVLDPRKCEYLKDYSLDFEHAYMTTYLAS